MSCSSFNCDLLSYFYCNPVEAVVRYEGGGTFYNLAIKSQSFVVLVVFEAVILTNISPGIGVFVRLFPVLSSSGYCRFLSISLNPFVDCFLSSVRQKYWYVFRVEELASFKLDGSGKSSSAD